RAGRHGRAQQRQGEPALPGHRRFRWLLPQSGCAACAFLDERALHLARSIPGRSLPRGRRCSRPARAQGASRRGRHARLAVQRHADRRRAGAGGLHGRVCTEARLSMDVFRIRTLNNIARSKLERLPADRYRVGGEIEHPDAILVRSADMHAMDIPPSVKAVARAGAGTNNIPVAALSERGVPVFNAPGANANAVKELVVAGMLLAARNVGEALGFVATLGGAPDPKAAMEAEKKRFVGFELEGKTLGVVGLGAIGVKVANAALALGMRAIGHDPHMTVEGAWQLSSQVAKAGSLNGLFAASDFISFHVPLNDATRGLFGGQALALARPGVVLLNFARDGIVDPATLREGLADGRIGRYVTDFPP